MQLDIVVSPHCLGRDEAHLIARWIQRLFPDLTVNIIEIDDRHPPPDAVVATPTYLLDGWVASLGNPRLPDLAGAIERHGAVAAHRRRPPWSGWTG